jgi:hypothetical protein
MIKPVVGFLQISKPTENIDYKTIVTNPCKMPGNSFTEMIVYLLYNLPLYILAPFWLICRMQEDKKFLSLRTLIDIVVVTLAMSRYFGPIVPTSGHALFLTHSLITIRSRYYRIPAVVMLIATAAVKVSWEDYSSLVAGILIGLISGAIWIGTYTISDVVVQLRES